MNPGNFILVKTDRRWNPCALRAGLLLLAALLVLPALARAQETCPALANVGIVLPNIGSQANSDNYCELCATSRMTARVYYFDDNNGIGNVGPPITDIVIRHNLDSPSLVPIPGTTTVTIGGGLSPLPPAPPAPAPVLAGDWWTWDFGSYELEPSGTNQGTARYLEIRYQVRRANGATEEGLAGAPRGVTASVSYSVGGPLCETDTIAEILPLRQPVASVIKQGRNADAGQSSGQYANNVYGHNNDDVIWRIQIQNTGLAALQDLRFDDLMQAGNLEIRYACSSEAAASAIADNNGELAGAAVPPGDICTAAGNHIDNRVVVDPFGSGGATNFPNGGATGGFTRDLNSRDIDVPPGSTSAVVYLVGKITSNASCIAGGTTNTVDDVQYGCEADGPAAGGIPAATAQTRVLVTHHGDQDAQLDIRRAFTGVDTVGTATVSNQPLGARGLVVLTIRNNTGGTVKDIELDDVLPPQYVIDPTYWTGGTTRDLPARSTPVAGESSINPAYGTNVYPGMVDRLTWENPQGLLTAPSLDPLRNTAPRFRLWSSTAHPVYPEQENMLRHGDVVTLTFPVVLISQDRDLVEPYDLAADLDETPEETGAGMDPAYATPLSNRLTVDYNTFCATQGNNGAGHFTWSHDDINTIEAFPEDLDVAITDTDNNPGDVFILTNDPTQQLLLRVRLTNNGGHTATGYHAFVTFGATMEVAGAPAGCSAVTPGGTPLQPDPWKVWVEPVPILDTQTVYHCPAPQGIGPGQTLNLDFGVIKSSDPARVLLDDLMLRADVVGEILLHDGTPLWFPAPIARADGQLDRTNNYSLDGVRQKVIGFNLIKSSLGCRENDPPAYEPGPFIKQAERVEIGEECSYRARSGGWFGFATPGFLYIAVEDVVVDDIPRTDADPSGGQGYLSSTDPYLTSSSQIQGITLFGAPVPPTPGGLIAPGGRIPWRFNETQRIDRIDEWFQADFTTRLLNVPINTVGLPNRHAANGNNVLVSDFTAIFADESGVEHPFRLDPDAVGYPHESIRREDVTITEPLLELVKEVCDETRFGTGPACGNWTAEGGGGDAYHSYIYRITVTNRADDDGIARSPAYDLAVTDTLDPSGFVCVLPFESDGLDNDADGGTDTAPEGTVTGTPGGDCSSGRNGVVTFRHEHSTGLRRIDPGESVRLYYRVDVDNDAAPMQTFTNSVAAAYDSLAGGANESGNQTVDPRPGGDIGGARVYESVPAVATLEILPVDTVPKHIVRTSNTPETPAPGPQEVVVGEEIEYRLTTLLPVALLRDFVIRDELPPGLTCVDAPVLDLGPGGPYADADFEPATPVTPSCGGGVVEWDFGNRRINRGTTPDNRYSFSIGFIARVENSTLTNDGDILANGDPATSATVRYIDEAGNPVEVVFGQVDVLVREPAIELSKTITPGEADAGDVLTVTVAATNTGTATAYNLRVLDDLSGIKLSYAAGRVAGADPPDEDLTTFGPERPLFTWPAGITVAPNETIEFSFAVTVDGTVEPDELLANTIQADWTSLPGRSTALNPAGEIGADGSSGGMRNGALPNTGDTLNDYEAEASDEIATGTVAVAKQDMDPALPSAIGAHKPFLLEISLPEGTTNGLVVTDNLAAGSESYRLARDGAFDVTYEFTGIAGINGLAPGESAFNASPADGASGAATWDIGTIVTASEDDTATQAVTPSIRIRYNARINNDLATDAGDTLQNAVDASYFNVMTGMPEILNDSTDAITVTEPGITATKTLTNATPGKNPDDPLEFGDIAEYLLTVVNTGDAVAHDINIVDTPPIELELSDAFVPAAAIDAVPVPGFAGEPDGAPAGPLVWGRGNGDESLDLPPNSFLELTYRMDVVAAPVAGPTIDNSVWIDWTSLDGESAYERTGAGCPNFHQPDDYCYGPVVAEAVPSPSAPPATLKENTQAVAGIGEPFTYRITIPAAPHPAPLYDVAITDNLADATADLRFLGARKVSGPGSWAPVNTGTDTNLVIEDPVNGIDVPAGQLAVIEITVLATNVPANAAGVTFTNTAAYTYNRLKGNDASASTGEPGTTGPMQIDEPQLTLLKSGPSEMRIGLPATFTLDVHNTTQARAYAVTITDRLPNTADGAAAGGMCAAAPDGFTAQMYEADGTTAAGGALVEGTDFAAAFTPAAGNDPHCTLTFTMRTPAAAIGPDQHLVVAYQARLDTDSEQDARLTNVAGATLWHSADPLAADTDPRSYDGDLTDGTVGTLDQEDAHTLLVNLPMLRFEKTVANVSRNVSPAELATPGERLRYSLTIENLRDVPVEEFSLHDELDARNGPGQPAFEPGTLTVIAAPEGADTSNTSATGGAHGTGLLDIRGLSLGGSGDSVLVEYEATLAPVLADGSFVYNQAQLLTGGFPIALSDDPNVNGPDDPRIFGDEDATQIRIESAPQFQVEKIPAYLEGDPNVLLAGERLRYTITVRNTGTDHATGARLRDAIPANTTYVAGSTTLNGAPVADGPSGLAPLVDGIAIHAPEDPTPGFMPADATAEASNVATITFDVAVYPDALDGTVISNQAFVSAPDGGIIDHPSDDPRTPVADDPTRDAVGNAPLLYAEKSAALDYDAGTAGIVDPGDVLRYTIRIYNNSAIAATGAALRDDVPQHATYVADSLTLNGEPVGRPDGGISALVGGLNVSSPDRTPPLPGPGEGVLSPGEFAVVQFDLRVDDDATPGTLILNQAVVVTAELPDLRTDGDGNPATGPEPTVVVVGDAQVLSITKQVSVVGGGAALAGSTIEYLVTVSNLAAVPAHGVAIMDDLDTPVAGQLTFVGGSWTMNGLPDGIDVAGSLLTARYSDAYGPLEPGRSVTLRFRAVIDPGLQIGTRVTNTAIVHWNDPEQTASASVSIDVGGTPGIGILNGRAWHDADFDGLQGAGERALEGWQVGLYRDDRLLLETQTDAGGAYRLAGLEPNDLTGSPYELRFGAPGAGANSAMLGRAASPFTNGLQRISDIVLPSGANLQGLNLPIQPNGVVYNSVARIPVAGATLTLLDADVASPLPAGCFDDAAQQGQVTLADGYYKFDLNFSDPACPSGGNYIIDVEAPPGTAYLSGTSQIIPPVPAGPAEAFSVPACPGSPADAVPATALFCEIQPSELAPAPAVPARSAGTNHHIRLMLDGSRPPGSSQIFNNHIPIDPELDGAVAISKTTPLVNVTRGQLVPYVITVNNISGLLLTEASVVDRFPAGFSYVEGSARMDGVPAEPSIAGRELRWSGLVIAGTEVRTLRLLLAVGAGVAEGEYVNRARVANGVTGGAMSGEANATVRVVPDPLFDCTDVTGKVFNDANRNRVQDAGEDGLPGVRLVTPRGLQATTDPYGRYHITCAITPHEGRGSNFVLKLDDRTLPSGFRLSTDPVEIRRATRGKALTINFGASIDRVVGIDLSDAAFEPGETEIRAQWLPRLDLLIRELHKAPAVLRLSYIADIETAALVEERVKAVRRRLTEAWNEAEESYGLAIEHEVFWRRGGPPEHSGLMNRSGGE
ncbi:MAG: DUF11 domain-containing protein [Anaerolineales bacterium]|nr:DUF11 domain-containing protein [Anaerolineales bacterium]